MSSCRAEILLLISKLGTKYDLDFKAPNKSGQNFKSGEDMIGMYQELCTGITSLSMFYNLFIYVSKFGLHMYPKPRYFSSLLHFLVLPEYSIVSIEDPFDKEDWEHAKNFSSLGLCQVCLIFLSVIFGYGPLCAVSIHL